MAEQSDLIEMTTGIVAAYVAANPVPAADLPGLIQVVHKALADVQYGPIEEPVAAKPPATTIRKSITPDYLVCLEDGRKFRSLKRHLRTKYNLSPEDYRAKWGLPKDYPMVAPSYAAARSALAKAIGLGQGGRKTAKAPTAQQAPPAKRGKAS